MAATAGPISSTSNARPVVKLQEMPPAMLDFAISKAIYAQDNFMNESEIAHFLKGEMEAAYSEGGDHGTWHVIVGKKWWHEVDEEGSDVDDSEFSDAESEGDEPSKSENLAVNEPVGEHEGCEHYKRRCKILAPCCGEWFWCRHCHNEAKGHLAPRCGAHISALVAVVVATAEEDLQKESSGHTDSTDGSLHENIYSASSPLLN
ncbi:hypothetical protein FOL47_007254 [Perkinsus chesapeaki]|uniref:CHY-type domain-containing protein n=1 Tax=Perkinsus chesapeaki TaxID=330153 RepID=A0A7J6LLT7_PERCH|nr:hypothetical protein FOL47_007254 [Perkinsus chesapeaki]